MENYYALWKVNVSNNYLQLYIDATFRLADTLVIKSEYASKQLFDYTERLAPGTSDLNDPRTWKYYMNLAGLYHPTDQVIQVVSADTLETIDFTIENLKVHRATSRAYQYGTRQYKELIAQYPESETVILGVLYPCDLESSVKAEDYSILGWPSDLVEQYEVTLIPKLDAWVKRFIQRWRNTQYLLTDDLYEATLLGVLHLNIVNALLALRLEAALTEEVHSFYIRQYFASHGYLDRYLDSLNRKQIMYLYKNLPWIMRHAGKTDTFETLVDKLLTERNIPLVSYRMTHDISGLLDSLKSEPRFKQIAENVHAQPNEDVYAKTSEILEKQDRLATENSSIRIQSASEIDDEFAYSLSNRMTTKTLESTMYDYSDAGPYRLSDVLLDHWLYLSGTGRYTSYVSIVNPKTGIIFPITVKDAYVLAQYLSNYSQGRVLEEIPAFLAKRVQRNLQPSIEELQSIVDKTRIDEAFIRDMVKYRPLINRIISVDHFYETCTEIHLSMVYQRFKTANVEDLHIRGQAQALHTLTYGTRKLYLEPEGTRYGEWFRSLNIEIEDFLDPETIETNYSDIVNAATGVGLVTTRSIRDVQRDMIKMSEQLGSYSVHYLRSINATAIEIADWPTVRITDPVVTGKNIIGLAEIHVDPMTRLDHAKHRVQVDVGDLADVIDFRTTLDSHFKLDLPTLIGNNLGGRFGRREHFFVNVADLHVHAPIDHEKYKGTGVVPVPGIDLYLDLPNEEREKIPDIPLG